MSVIPIIASIHDVEGAIRHGNRNPSSRWYISKRLDSLGVPDLVPSDWATVAAGLPDFLKDKADDGDGEKKKCSVKDCDKDAVMFGKCKEHAKTKKAVTAALTRRQARGKMGGMTAAATWDGDVHPRDRNGRFIEKFDIVDVFPSGLASDVGQFRGIAVGNRKGEVGDDQIIVKIDHDITFAGQTVKAGTELPVSVDDIESAPNPKARLDGKPVKPGATVPDAPVADRDLAVKPSQKMIDAEEARYDKAVATKDKLKEGGAARAKAEENLVAHRARIDKMYTDAGMNAPGDLKAVPDAEPNTPVADTDPTTMTDGEIDHELNGDLANPDFLDGNQAAQDRREALLMEMTENRGFEIDENGDLVEGEGDDGGLQDAIDAINDMSTGDLIAEYEAVTADDFDGSAEYQDAVIEAYDNAGIADLDENGNEITTVSFDGSEEDLKQYNEEVRTALVDEGFDVNQIDSPEDEIGAGYEAEADPRDLAVDLADRYSKTLEDDEDYQADAGKDDAPDDNPMDELRAEGPDGEMPGDWIAEMDNIRQLLDVDSGLGAWASGLNDSTFEAMGNYLEEYQQDPESQDGWFRDKLDGLTRAAEAMEIDDPHDLIVARQRINQLGWAQEEQLQAILSGEPLGQQNPAALRNIADVMHALPSSIRNTGGDHSFEELSDAIHHYLDSPGPDDYTEAILETFAFVEGAIGGDPNDAVLRGFRDWATAVFEERDGAGNPVSLETAKLVNAFATSALDRRKEQKFPATDQASGEAAGRKHIDDYGIGFGGKDNLALFPIGDPRESNFGGYDVWHVNPDGSKNGGRGSYPNREAAQGYIDGYNSEWDKRFAAPQKSDALEQLGELYRDDQGNEVWRVKDASGNVVQDGIASDDDAKFIAEIEYGKGAGDSVPPGDPEPIQVKASQSEAANKVRLMGKSANKDSVAISEAQANEQLDAIFRTADEDPDAAHKLMASLMTELKLGGKQRKRYRELLDEHVGATDDTSAEVQATAVADALRDDNPVKEKLSAKAQAFMDKHSAGKVATEPTVYPQAYQPSSPTPAAPAPAAEPTPAPAPTQRAPEDLTDADLTDAVSKAKAEYDDSPYGSPDQKRFAARYRELRAEQRDRIEAKKSDAELVAEVNQMIAEHNAEYGDSEPEAGMLAEWRTDSILADLMAGDQTILVKGEIEHTVTRRQALAMLRSIGVDTTGIPGKA